MGVLDDFRDAMNDDLQAKYLAIPTEAEMIKASEEVQTLPIAWFDGVGVMCAKEGGEDQVHQYLTHIATVLIMKNRFFGDEDMSLPASISTIVLQTASALELATKQGDDDERMRIVLLMAPVFALLSKLEGRPEFAGK